MIADERARERRAELARLAAEQVVEVRTAAGFHGSGFLISSDTVLTCAHVVNGRTGLSVSAHGTTVEVDVVRLAPEVEGFPKIYPYPDLAMLRLRRPIPGTGVWLGEESPAPGADVAAYGFSQAELSDGIAAGTLLLKVVGKNAEFVRVKEDRVVPGFSGGPVLDLDSGRVCGVLKASRNEKDDQGGWLVPVEAIRDRFPEVVADNERGHHHGSTWFDTARDRVRHERNLFPPSGGHRPRVARRLTPAQHLAQNTMPFVDRPELADLQAWCQDPTDHLVRLLHAAGGSGKTRLATELCRWASAEGWIAGFMDKGQDVQWRKALTEALTAGFPVLLVLDDAQAHLRSLRDVLDHLYTHAPERMRVRVLLLARSTVELERALEDDDTPTDVIDWALADLSVVPLSRTIPVSGDTSLVHQAFRAFAHRLDCGSLDPPAALEALARGSETVLDVLALALDAVITLGRGDEWSDAEDPLKRICTHELQTWRTALASRLPAGTLSWPDDVGVADALLLVPTLVPERSPQELTALLTRAHRAAFQSDRPLRMDRVLATLVALYPAAGGGVAPLKPDRLGELLVRRVVADLDRSGKAGGYLGVVLDQQELPTTEARIEAAGRPAAVLARARGCAGFGGLDTQPGHQALDAALAEVTARDPEVLLPVLVNAGRALPHPEPLAAVMLPELERCEPSLLLAVERLLPGYPSGLSSAAVLVLARLLESDEAEFTTERQVVRLRRLMRYSLRLDEIGRTDTALDAARQSVGLSRDLVRQSEEHLAAYAAARHNLSLMLQRAGGLGPALEQSVAAVGAYERLLLAQQAEADAGGSDVHRLDAATALATLALLRLADGQSDGATTAALRGVALCRAARGSERRRTDTLLICLEAVVECAQLAGRIEAALDAGAEAVDLLRELTELQPGRYQARLPDGLYRLARVQIRAGRYRDAYLALREEVYLRRLVPGSHAERLVAQRRSLRVLAELSLEVREFTHERGVWLTQLEPLGQS